MTPKRTANSAVGRLLKQKRIGAGYGPSAIAALMGVHFNTILNYEAGRLAVPNQRIFDLAHALETDPRRLLDEVEAVRNEAARGVAV